MFPGCLRPPSHCQAHHLKFWTRDQGPTDIDNLALVCAFHHWLIHDKHWTLQPLPVSAEAPAGGWQAKAPKDSPSPDTDKPPPDLLLPGTANEARTHSRKSSATGARAM